MLNISSLNSEFVILKWCERGKGLKKYTVEVKDYYFYLSYLFIMLIII